MRNRSNKESIFLLIYIHKTNRNFVSTEPSSDIPVLKKDTVDSLFMSKLSKIFRLMSVKSLDTWRN